MPLTGVGKIFKHELKLREIEDSLTEALRVASVPFASVNAQSDPTHGTRVDVALAEGADPQSARRELGRFSFRFRLVDAMGSAAPG